MVKITALLPMKGHSERIPNKNMRLFYGRPLYYQIIETLLSSNYISDIVINTDSPVIAENAIRHFDQIKILNRPKELQGDFIPMNDIIAHDLSQLNGEHFLQTHSTNPLLTTTTIEKAINSYFKNLYQYDSLFSVTRLQSRLYWKDARPINHDPQKLLRTQDLSPLFEENSNLYIFSKGSFKRAGNNRIGLKTQMFEIDKCEAIDIDEERDFKLAEILYQMSHAQKERVKIDRRSKCCQCL